MGKLVHLLHTYFLEVLHENLIFESQQNRKFLGTNCVRIGLMRLQLIGQQSLTNFVLKHLNILLLLVFYFLLVVSCHPTFQQNIVMAIVLPLFDYFTVLGHLV